MQVAIEWITEERVGGDIALDIELVLHAAGPIAPIIAEDIAAADDRWGAVAGTVHCLSIGAEREDAPGEDRIALAYEVYQRPWPLCIPMRESARDNLWLTVILAMQ